MKQNSEQRDLTETKKMAMLEGLSSNNPKAFMKPGLRDLRCALYRNVIKESWAENKLV